MALQLWNGRGEREGEHYYVAANSQAEAVRLLRAAGHASMTPRELRIYYSKAWGNPMKDVTPERGVWLARGYPEQPRRIL